MTKALIPPLLALLAGATAAQPATAPAGLLDCMIQPHQVVLLGSAAPGVIDHILVDRGDTVARGQPVVHLRAGVERAALAAMRQRATHEGEITVASSSHELAQRELLRANELFEQNFVSKNYLDKQRAEVNAAQGRSDQAQERRSLASREVDMATAQLDQRTIRSPIAGVVVERFMSPGEYVEQKPVLRIATIDPLRVDVLVPAAAFGQVAIGMKGSVVPELFGTTPRTATVTTVDRVIDAASSTYRVRLELPNPNGALPAGLRCKVDLGLKLTTANANEAPVRRASPSAAAAAPVVPVELLRAVSSVPAQRR